MPDCQYCSFSADGEAGLREHLYGEHEPDELGRIDARRVESYVDEHGLDDDDGADETAPTERARIPERLRGGVLSEGRWSFHEVRALSTPDVLANLEKLDIETSEQQFRDRAADADSAEDVADRWIAESDVEVAGDDDDFVWMAAIVLWRRWAPDVPTTDSFDDFFEE